MPRTARPFAPSGNGRSSIVCTATVVMRSRRRRVSRFWVRLSIATGRTQADPLASRAGASAGRPPQMNPTSNPANDDALRELWFADALFRQRYEGWNVLGRGPWATVVGVTSRDLEQDVALKLFINLACEVRERVRNEVRALQSLGHTLSGACL